MSATLQAKAFQQVKTIQKLPTTLQVAHGQMYTKMTQQMLNQLKADLGKPQKAGNDGAEVKHNNQTLILLSHQQQFTTSHNHGTLILQSVIGHLI